MKKIGPDPDLKFLRLFKSKKLLPRQFEIHQILLEFIFHSHIGIFDRLTLGVFMSEYPIQEIPFDYGIKVTNVGRTFFNGGWLERLMISQRSPSLTYLNPNNRIKVPELKPSESLTIWCGRLKTHFQGAISVECRIRPNNEEHAIETYQRITGSEPLEASENQPSNWYINTYIEPRSELLLRNTNMLLILLALLTFLNIKFSGILAGIKAILGH